MTERTIQDDVPFIGSRTKPPIGITPEWYWREQRVMELIRAIARYDSARNEVTTIDIPEEWFKELHNHLAFNYDRLRNEA